MQQIQISVFSSTVPVGPPFASLEAFPDFVRGGDNVNVTCTVLGEPEVDIGFLWFYPGQVRVNEGGIICRYVMAVSLVLASLCIGASSSRSHPHFLEAGEQRHGPHHTTLPERPDRGGHGDHRLWRLHLQNQKPTG